MKRLLSLSIWAILVAALVVAAYMYGAKLASRWLGPSMALPPLETSAPTPSPQAQAAVQLVAGEPGEGNLAAEAGDEWAFDGHAGQSATVEMWLHPGSGSSLDAELALRLIAPDGTELAEETGSLFLPPYLVIPQLPVDGAYLIEVAPVSGAPGRYSLALMLADAAALTAPDATSVPQSAAEASDATMVAGSQGLFQWPTPGRRISGWTFHDPRNPGHVGLDIGANMWDPIVTIADGVVVFAEWGGGYGNLVIVEHGRAWRSYYAHLTEITVQVGQEVRQGELLGGAGSTGYSTGPHLHFEIRYYGRPVDPHVYLP